MTKNEVSFSLKQLKKAWMRLKESIEASADGDELKQDGAIQRFEFTFELLWKTLRIYFSYTGKETTNPRNTLKMAVTERLFSDEDSLLAMLDDRNESSHVYDFATTRRIFGHVREKYLDTIEALIKEIEKQIQ